MEYEWDAAKEVSNQTKHRIGFDAISDFNWNDAIIVNRSRHKDGEPRFAGIGLIDGKLFTIIFTWRQGRMRVISLRRANKAEERLYEKAT